MATQDDSLFSNQEDDKNSNLPLQNEEFTKIENDFLMCKNCGFEPTDHYCPKCGQRKQERFGFKYIIEELLALFEFEKGFFKNIVEFTLRPAKTIEEYLNGKTKDLYSPFSYFFVSMTIFLFISFNFPISSTFNKEENKNSPIFNIKEQETKLKKKYADKLKTLSSQIANTDSLRWREFLIRQNLNEEIATLKEFRESELNLYRDSVFIAKNGKEDTIHSFFYTSVSHQLIDLQKEQEEELKKLEKDSLVAQIMTYTVFYFTPLYLAFIVSLFYYKKKLYFTEHLIIQTFITTQLIIFITFLVGIYRLLYWIIYNLNKEANFAKEINHYLAGWIWLIGVVGIIGYYFYVSFRLYKQSWWLTLLKCLGISIVLLFIALSFFLLVNILFVK